MSDYDILFTELYRWLKLYLESKGCDYHMSGGRTNVSTNSSLGSQDIWLRLFGVTPKFAEEVVLTEIQQQIKGDKYKLVTHYQDRIDIESYVFVMEYHECNTHTKHP